MLSKANISLILTSFFRAASLCGHELCSPRSGLIAGTSPWPRRASGGTGHSPAKDSGRERSACAGRRWGGAALTGGTSGLSADAALELVLRGS